MTRRLITIATLVTGLAGFGTPAAATGPAARDGFETRIANATSERVLTGEAIGRWTVSRGDVDLTTATMWQVTEGRQNIDLDGGQAGAIVTTVPARAGETYRITYQLAGNPKDPRTTKQTLKTGELRVNGKVVQKFAFDTTGRSTANMGYIGRTAHVVSTGTSMRVEFASTMPRAAAGWGPVIDDVRVEATDE